MEVVTYGAFQARKANVIGTYHVYGTCKMNPYSKDGLLEGSNTQTHHMKRRDIGI